MGWLGLGGARDKDGVKYEDSPADEDTRVVVKDGTPMSRRVGDTAANGVSRDGRLRQFEQRAAHAQQRSLGKKISALTEEMAAVEAMLNGAAASNQVDMGFAAERRDDLHGVLSSIEAQQQVKAREAAFDIAARASGPSDSSAGSEALPWQHLHSTSPESVTPTARRGQPRQSRRRLHGEDDNDKYSARPSRGWDAVLVYFGRGEQASLPLPVGIQRSGKMPFDFERALVAIAIASLAAAAVIYALSVSGALQVQHGAHAGARGWGGN